MSDKFPVKESRPGFGGEEWPITRRPDQAREKVAICVEPPSTRSTAPTSSNLAR